MGAETARVLPASCVHGKRYTDCLGAYTPGEKIVISSKLFRPKNDHIKKVEILTISFLDGENDRS